MEGNLNYVFTRLLLSVYGDKDTTRYSNINDAMGLLECVKQEFYRKVAAPYEDQKEFDNGGIARIDSEPEVTAEVVIKTKKRMEEDSGVNAANDV